MERNSRWQRLCEGLWLRPADEGRYAVVRIAFATIALLHLIALWPYRLAFFSVDGMVDQGAAVAEAQFFYPSLFGILESGAAVTGYFIFSALAIVALGLGWMPRLAAFLVWLWFLSFTARAPVATTGWDLVLRSFSFLVFVSPMGKSWRFPGPFCPPPVQWAPIYGLTLMRLQVLVVYWQSVLWRWHDPYWQNGEFFAYFLLSHHARWPTPAIAEAVPLMQAITLATLVLELILPILLFVRRTRWIGIALGCAFHIAIIIAARNITLFSLTMIMTYTAFLRDTDLARLRAWLSFGKKA